MIIDLEKFIMTRKPDWDEFESMLEFLESDSRHQLSPDEVQRFHFLYERVAADLAKLSVYAAEPKTKVYLESLVARGFGEMHGRSRGLPLLTRMAQLVTVFPKTFRTHIRLFLLVVALFGGGAIFGALALALDETAKPVLMPFSHLLGDPSERVAEEEAEAADSDPMAGGKSTFSASLMTHNTKVAILTLALGMTFGVGTGVILFYNGAAIGAVIMDYILAGEGVFLTGWLLPHGSVEIPAILLAGQAGLLLGRTLLFAEGRQSLSQRLRNIRSDLVILISGIAVLLVWAGIIESFMSQYHEPILPYSVKIAFGAVQLLGLIAYLALVGRKEEGALPA